MKGGALLCALLAPFSGCGAAPSPTTVVPATTDDGLADLPALPRPADLRRRFDDQLRLYGFHAPLPLADAPLIAGYRVDATQLQSLAGWDGVLQEGFLGTSKAGEPVKLPTGYFSGVYGRGSFAAIRYSFTHRVRRDLSLQIMVVVAQRSVLDMYEDFLSRYELSPPGAKSVGAATGTALGDGSLMYGHRDDRVKAGLAVQGLTFVRGNVRVRLAPDFGDPGAGDPDMTALSLAVAREIDAQLVAAPKFASISASGQLPVIEHLGLAGGVSHVKARALASVPVVVRVSAPPGAKTETWVSLLNGSEDGTMSRGVVGPDPYSGSWLYYPGAEPREHQLIAHVVTDSGLVATRTLQVTATR